MIRNDWRFSIDEQTLDVEFAEMDDSGNITCVGENRLGLASKLFRVEVTMRKNEMPNIFA